MVKGPLEIQRQKRRSLPLLRELACSLQDKNSVRRKPAWRAPVFSQRLDAPGEQLNITLENWCVCNARVPQINLPFSMFVLGLS